MAETDPSPDGMPRTDAERIAELERIVMLYVERYGLIGAARDYFRSLDPSEEGDRPSPDGEPPATGGSASP